MTDTAIPIVEANGANIPALGFGTWPMKDETCAQAVAEALRAGYRHIDTAEMYGNEAAVGEGLRASGVERHEIFVTTKIWHDHLKADDARKAAEASLKRLGLDRVDLLLIHWPDNAMTAAEMLEGLCACRKAGLTRHIGVSNFPTTLLDAALDAAQKHGERLAANQVEHHPELDQSKLLASCRAHGLALVSYAPLGKGGLLERPEIRAVADAHGRTPGQIVLRWHIQQKGVVAIPKSQTPERIRANLAIGDFALSPEEMRALHALARPDGRKIDPDWAPTWDVA